ncbi:MAG: ABC transporter ATP-binding protein [Clostridia bacterium]|nr:ABC transporter ATP-binding protein [Clostridia bacterium]
MHHMHEDPEAQQLFRSNVDLTEGQTERIKTLSGDEEVLFAIAADLSMEGRYDDSLFFATDKAVYSSSADGDGVFRLPYSEVESAEVKRCYGNALLTIRKRDGKTDNFIRFSLKTASVFEAAALFIARAAEGEALESLLPALEETFEKQRSVCPKCGRSLIRPGAACIYCSSKRRFIKKIGHYILPHKWLLLFCVLLSVVTTAMSLLPPYMTKTLVDEVFPHNDLRLLHIVVALLFGAHLLQHLLGIVRSYFLRKCGDSIVKEFRADIYAKAQYLPMRFYDSTSTGSVINRISGDTSTLQAFMLRITQEVVVQFFQLIGIIVIMLSMNWELTLLSLIPVPFVVVFARIFGQKIRPFYVKIWRRWSAVTSILTDTLPGIRVIKAFTSEKKAIDNFNEYNDEWLKTDIRSARITISFPHLISFVITCGSLLIWGLGGTYVIKTPDFITVGLLVSFISYTSMFYGPVNFFANLNDSYQHALAAAERIMDIIDAEPENDFSAGEHPKNFKGKIEFRHVNFSFDRSKNTLSDINFVIEPGEIVGIVGTTGSGKSTMINLLMRYYDGYDGEILVDDIDIRKIDMNFYRSKIGYVQQEPMMFRDTIFNNIAFGSDDPTPEEVIHAADVANAHEFIARMPDAYDTLLGERGIGVSGGEKQRLSIARAVLKNPSILFFDEATASVDSETEALIQGAIERLISGRTTIMVAHRLSTLRRATKIIVVDKGEILEMGTPEELMAKKGKYYRLVQIQTMRADADKMKEEERFE